MNLKWEQLKLNEVSKLWMGDEIYPERLHERMEVIEEKFQLFPFGCKKLVMDEEIVGYCLAHPYILNFVPYLDEFLYEIPKNPTCLYLHDCAILPKARGFGMSKQFIDEMENIANIIGVKYLTGTSVMGTYKLWERYGFKVIPTENLPTTGIGTYGEDAKYIVKVLK